MYHKLLQLRPNILGISVAVFLVITIISGCIFFYPISDTKEYQLYLTKSKQVEAKILSPLNEVSNIISNQTILINGQKYRYHVENIGDIEEIYNTNIQPIIISIDKYPLKYKNYFVIGIINYNQEQIYKKLIEDLL